MNKTVNINLGGMFFHIDEDAYQKLTRYFDAIKRSLSNSNGQDEIIKDIEMRIGELITEKHTSDKQVINLKKLMKLLLLWDNRKIIESMMMHQKMVQITIMHQEKQKTIP